MIERRGGRSAEREIGSENGQATWTHGLHEIGMLDGPATRGDTRWTGGGWE